MTLLYLDFDGPVPATLVPWITQCCKLWQWPVEAVRYDRTRRGWHVVVGVRKRIAPPLVVAAQAIFGSDAKREAFNLMRVTQLHRQPKFWRDRFNVLYESHHRNVTVKKRDT